MNTTARIFGVMLVLGLAALVDPIQVSAQDGCYMCSYNPEIGCEICSQQPTAIDGYDDCSQIACDECWQHGNPCTATVATSDLSPDGSLFHPGGLSGETMSFAAAIESSERVRQVRRRECDGAILARHYSVVLADALRSRSQRIGI